jgi:hypothetical protein
LRFSLLSSTQPLPPPLRLPLSLRHHTSSSLLASFCGSYLFSHLFAHVDAQYCWSLSNSYKHLSYANPLSIYLHCIYGYKSTISVCDINLKLPQLHIQIKADMEFDISPLYTRIHNPLYP